MRLTAPKNIRPMAGTIGLVWDEIVGAVQYLVALGQDLPDGSKKTLGTDSLGSPSYDMNTLLKDGTIKEGGTYTAVIMAEDKDGVAGDEAEVGFIVQIQNGVITMLPASPAPAPTTLPPEPDRKYMPPPPPAPAPNADPAIAAEAAKLAKRLADLEAVQRRAEKRLAEIAEIVTGAKPGDIARTMSVASATKAEADKIKEEVSKINSVVSELKKSVADTATKADLNNLTGRMKTAFDKAEASFADLGKKLAELATTPVPDGTKKESKPFWKSWYPWAIGAALLVPVLFFLLCPLFGRRSNSLSVSPSTPTNSATGIAASNDLFNKQLQETRDALAALKAAAPSPSHEAKTSKPASAPIVVDLRSSNSTARLASTARGLVNGGIYGNGNIVNSRDCTIVMTSPPVVITQHVQVIREIPSTPAPAPQAPPQTYNAPRQQDEAVRDVPMFSPPVAANQYGGYYEPPVNYGHNVAFPGRFETRTEFRRDQHGKESSKTFTKRW